MFPGGAGAPERARERRLRPAAGPGVRSSCATLRSIYRADTSCRPVWRRVRPVATRAEVLELAILGQLGAAPMHGYELRRQLSAQLGAFRTLSYGSLYPALRRLTEAALITETSSDTLPHAPARRRAPIVYRLTTAGRERPAATLASAEPTASDDDAFHVPFTLFETTAARPRRPTGADRLPAPHGRAGAARRDPRLRGADGVGRRGLRRPLHALRDDGRAHPAAHPRGPSRPDGRAARHAPGVHPAHPRTDGRLHRGARPARPRAGRAGGRVAGEPHRHRARHPRRARPAHPRPGGQSAGAGPT